MGIFKCTLETLNELAKFAEIFATCINKGDIIYLNGQLGAGKTTLTQLLFGYLGVGSRVKSPTYTLVESYQVEGLHLHHFDLYRLGDPEELYFLGLEHYFNEDAICVVEWPEKGADVLPEPTWIIDIQVKKNKRHYTVTAANTKGKIVTLQNAFNNKHTL